MLLMRRASCEFGSETDSLTSQVLDQTTYFQYEHALSDTTCEYHLLYYSGDGAGDEL